MPIGDWSFLYTSFLLRVNIIPNLSLATSYLYPPIQLTFIYMYMHFATTHPNQCSLVKKPTIRLYPVNLQLLGIIVAFVYISPFPDNNSLTNYKTDVEEMISN